MNRELEKNLMACLDNLEQGSSIDAALAGYPVEAAELRPYLKTAGQISRLASLPSIAAQQQSQATFLAGAAALRSPQSSPTPIWFILRRLMRPLASLAVILFLLGFTLVTMSAAALPGDGLYSVKLEIEEFRLMRASDSERILILAEQFQQERLLEVEALLRARRTADVLFEGEIEAIDVAAWIIAGLAVQIDNDTVIDGTPQVGELARVDGRTVDGQLIAGHIIVLTGAPDPEEIPLPALIPTLEPVETAEPGVTPTVTQTPVEDQGDSAAIVPPAATVDPPATSTPANDSDAANGNEDDSSDDSGDVEGSDEPGDDDSDYGGDDDNSNEEDEENSNEEDSDSGGDEGSDEPGEDDSDEPGEDDSDNGGDDDNSNEEDEENSNEEDSDSGGDEPGEEYSNDNDEVNENDEEDSGANENDDDSEESVDDGGDGDNE